MIYFLVYFIFAKIRITYFYHVSLYGMPNALKFSIQAALNVWQFEWLSHNACETQDDRVSHLVSND